MTGATTPTERHAAIQRVRVALACPGYQPTAADTAVLLDAYDRLWLARTFEMQHNGPEETK